MCTGWLLAAAVIHDFNDFNRTENSCCIRTCSDGGIRLNDLFVWTCFVPPPVDDFCGLLCRWCRSIFPSVHTFAFARSSPPLHLAPLFVNTGVLTKCALMLSALFSSVCKFSQTDLSVRRWATKDPVVSQRDADVAVCTARRFWVPFWVFCWPFRLLLGILCIQELFWRFEELEALVFFAFWIW